MRYITKIKLTLIREKIESYNVLLPDKIASSKEAYLYFKHLSELPQEEVHVLYLDSQNKVIGMRQAHKGTHISCLTSSADIIRPALLCNAVGIIMAHNHPSGDCNPSKDDLVVTERINDACKIMGINLLDHIIIGNNKYYSINEKHF